MCGWAKNPQGFFSQRQARSVDGKVSCEGGLGHSQFGLLPSREKRATSVGQEGARKFSRTAGTERERWAGDEKQNELRGRLPERRRWRQEKRLRATSLRFSRRLHPTLPRSSAYKPAYQHSEIRVRPLKLISGAMNCLVNAIDARRKLPLRLSAASRYAGFTIYTWDLSASRMHDQISLGIQTETVLIRRHQVNRQLPDCGVSGYESDIKYNLGAIQAGNQRSDIIHGILQSIGVGPRRQWCHTYGLLWLVVRKSLESREHVSGHYKSARVSRGPRETRSCSTHRNSEGGSLIVYVGYGLPWTTAAVNTFKIDRNTSKEDGNRVGNLTGVSISRDGQEQTWRTHASATLDAAQLQPS
ncbi:hypothetical protein OG21DRAFT_1520467 [Imleria badia]|nr:hypothetical protein OG21DRAFT_1520467 [Imleria badia]